MIGLDTNVLIRFLTQDDVKQSSLVNQMMAEFETHEEELWISLMVICEVVWVLESCYNQSRHEIANTLTQILQTQQLKIESENIVSNAIQDYATHKKIDFSDCLIGRYNKYQNCEYTYTFDKTAATSHSFKLLK